MPRNIEIKARVDDPQALAARVAALGADGPVAIAQDDTFFRCVSGRLKLRMFSPTAGELIHYERADAQAPKASSYTRVPTADPLALRDALAGALGAIGHVRKARTLYCIGNTRIHLDDVDGLGHFLELEVVLGDADSDATGIAIARELMARLHVRDDALVGGAYVDLLGDRA